MTNAHLKPEGAGSGESCGIHSYGVSGSCLMLCAVRPAALNVEWCRGARLPDDLTMFNGDQGMSPLYRKDVLTFLSRILKSVVMMSGGRKEKRPAGRARSADLQGPECRAIKILNGRTNTYYSLLECRHFLKASSAQIVLV